MKEFTSDRYTVSVGAPARDAMQQVAQTTHFKTAADIIRAGIAILVDLLDAKGRGLTIVLRAQDGREWAYSPHEPGRATAITPQADADHDQVLRPTFATPGEPARLGLQLGLVACANVPANDTNIAVLAPRRRRK